MKLRLHSTLAKGKDFRRSLASHLRLLLFALWWICCGNALQSGQDDALHSAQRDGGRVSDAACESGRLKQTHVQRIPHNEALKNLKLHWSIGLYHDLLLNTEHPDAAQIDVTLPAQRPPAVRELLKLLLRARTGASPRPWGGTGDLVEAVIGSNRINRAEWQDTESRGAIEALEQALLQHAEAYVAAAWRHPLLDAKAGFDAAVAVEIVDSWALWLRGDSRDHVLPWDAVRREQLVGILALSDAGDAACAESPTLRMLDPRAAAAASLPPLLQLGAFSNVCLRSGELWLVPSAVPVQALPHANSAERALLFFSVRLRDRTSPQLLDLFLLSGDSERGSAGEEEGARRGDGRMLVTRRAGGVWRAWAAAVRWEELLRRMWVRWPTAIYQTVDEMVLETLSEGGALQRLWSEVPGCLGPFTGAGEGSEEVGVARRVLWSEGGGGGAEEEGGWVCGGERVVEAARAERVRERVEAHLRGALQGWAAHPFMTRYHRTSPAEGRAAVAVTELAVVAWRRGGLSMPAIPPAQAAAHLSGFWYLASGTQTAEGGSGGGGGGDADEGVEGSGGGAGIAGEGRGEGEGVQVGDGRGPWQWAFGAEERRVGVGARAGRLAVFPSHLVTHHPPNQGASPRVALAFHARVQWWPPEPGGEAPPEGKLE